MFNIPFFSYCIVHFNAIELLKKESKTQSLIFRLQFVRFILYNETIVCYNIKSQNDEDS
jgi:hypothetical protein